MDIVILLLVLFLVFGGLGGGYIGYSHYGFEGGGGIFLTVIVICLVIYALRGRI